MKKKVSIAIETSSRSGGLAAGVGDELVSAVEFDASGRYASQLISRLDRLLEGAALRAGDLDEVYVSAGPGSFTGLRIGITVARMLAQEIPGLRCVSVATALAVARNARDLPWSNLGVIMDARDSFVYARLFTRRAQQIVPSTPGAVVALSEFLTVAPRPLTLIGEALTYLDRKGCRPELSADGVTLGDPQDPRLHLPSASEVWRLGRELSAAGQFTEYHRLTPMYVREPEAVRLWENRTRKGAT